MDARLIWSNLYGGYADLNLTSDGRLDDIYDLPTAVIVSLFTDRLAAASDKLPPNQDDRRGWWGDTDLQLDTPGDLIGSRLWLLERHTSDDKTPLLARGYILEALRWLIDDGVASSVECRCWFLEPFSQRKLAAQVTIIRGGQTMLELQFDWSWQEMLSEVMIRHDRFSHFVLGSSVLGGPDVL